MRGKWEKDKQAIFLPDLPTSRPPHLPPPPYSLLPTPYSLIYPIQLIENTLGGTSSNRHLQRLILRKDPFAL